MFSIFLLLYFLFVVVNLVIGSLFIAELKTSRADLWHLWGQPSSVFRPVKSNWELYKYIFVTERAGFGGNDKFYYLSKLLALSTVLTHVGFILAFVAFLLPALYLR